MHQTAPKPTHHDNRARPSRLRLKLTDIEVTSSVNAALGRYQQARRDFASLPIDVQNVFTSTELVSLGQGYADRARDLQRQGLQAGALGMAQNAVAIVETTTAAGELVGPLYTQGLAGLPTLFNRALDVSPAQAKVTSFLDQISTYRPETVSDVEGLVNAYAGTFDAYALLIFAVVANIACPILENFKIWRFPFPYYLFTVGGAVIIATVVSFFTDGAAGKNLPKQMEPVFKL